MMRSFGGACSPGALVCRIGDTISPPSASKADSHAAEVLRDGALQQRFWEASMVLTKALSARPVRRLELNEHSFIYHLYICRSIKLCLQAKLRSRSINMVLNSPQ